MPKGHHTAGVSVLFEAMPSAEVVAEAIAPLQILKRTSGQGGDWVGGRFGFVVPVRGEVSGALNIHGFDRPWPDGMGTSSNDPLLFGTWAMGFFGPFAFPGNLERAVHHARAWADAAEHVRRHVGFVRLAITYAGGEDQAPVVPAGYDALAELRFLTRAAQLVGAVPGAVAYFNPGGEVLRPLDALEASIDWHAARGLVPLEVWSTIRLFRPGIDTWAVMDTVGMGQLDVVDHEACFPADRVDPNEVAGFLRQRTEPGPPRSTLDGGDTVDGPGTLRWRPWPAQASLAPAPRPTLRWLPEGVDVPAPLRQGLLPAGDPYPGAGTSSEE